MCFFVCVGVVFGACLIHIYRGRGLEQSSQWIVSRPDNLARKQ